MKIIITGGTGQIGAMLMRHWQPQGHDIIMLTRSPKEPWQRYWDGRTLGDWAKEIEGADVVANLAGRSVNCRYTEANLQEMMDSRVDSARVMGEAIANCTKPPKLWLQMSTATIYAHATHNANDEIDHEIGGQEPDVPAYWEYSVRIAKNWEAELNKADTPHTRKVALRTAMVMSPDEGGVFQILSRLTRLGLGGPVGGGQQYVSWIHEADLVHAIDHIIANEALEGPINLAAPNPLPQGKFMAALRKAWGAPIGLPATKWMLDMAAVVMRTDSELLLKSRRVLPRKLLDHSYQFSFPDWSMAAADLKARMRDR